MFDPAVEEMMIIREGFSGVAPFHSKGSDLAEVLVNFWDKG